jgi:hypothetical protein
MERHRSLPAVTGALLIQSIATADILLSARCLM